MVLELPIPPSEAEFTNDVFPDRREIIAIDIALTQSRFDPNRDLTIFAERVRISDTVRTNGKALHRLAARRFRLLTIFCFASVF
jgi:hypothetical protein